MQIPRVYQAGKIQKGEALTLTEFACKHVIQVLRLNVGDPLILFNGTGVDFTATISAISKKHATVMIDDQRPGLPESALSIHLGQAISRGERMDYSIQKSVELGVAEITPLFTERCGVKLSGERLEKRLAHWQHVVISACEQSGRSVIPVIHPPLSLGAWLDSLTGEGVVCDPESNTLLATLPVNSGQIALLIGPEGGLSQEETQLAHKNHLKRVSLGPRVLRTETAGMVAITLLQGKFGDLK